MLSTLARRSFTAAVQRGPVRTTSVSILRQAYSSTRDEETRATPTKDPMYMVKVRLPSNLVVEMDSRRALYAAEEHESSLQGKAGNTTKDISELQSTHARRFEGPKRRQEEMRARQQQIQQDKEAREMYHRQQSQQAQQRQQSAAEQLAAVKDEIPVQIDSLLTMNIHTTHLMLPQGLLFDLQEFENMTLDGDEAKVEERLNKTGEEYFRANSLEEFHEKVGNLSNAHSKLLEQAMKENSDFVSGTQDMWFNMLQEEAAELANLFTDSNIECFVKLWQYLEVPQTIRKQGKRHVPLWVPGANRTQMTFIGDQIRSQHKLNFGITDSVSTAMDLPTWNDSDDNVMLTMTTLKWRAQRMRKHRRMKRRKANRADRQKMKARKDAKRVNQLMAEIARRGGIVKGN